MSSAPNHSVEEVSKQDSEESDTFDSPHVSANSKLQRLKMSDFNHTLMTFSLDDVYTQTGGFGINTHFPNLFLRTFPAVYVNDVLSSIHVWQFSGLFI